MKKSNEDSPIVSPQGRTVAKPAPLPALANLCRYQPAVDYTEANPKYVKVQTHVWNKPWAICKAEKNRLEVATHWPPKTYFTIELVK